MKSITLTRDVKYLPSGLILPKGTVLEFLKETSLTVGNAVVAKDADRSYLVPEDSFVWRCEE